MLAALPIAATLGVGSVKTPMVTAFSLGLGGNAITVSNNLFERMAAADSELSIMPSRSAQALQKVAKTDQKTDCSPLTFAMVFPFSSHHYLLRRWLVSGGLDPDRQVRIIVIPPHQMVAALESGAIDGYCVGEPWNSLAVQQGLGRIAITSYDLWNNHPEKVFGVHRIWAERFPNTHQAVLRSLLQAALWLDKWENRLEAVHLLAQPDYVDAPTEVIEPALSGRLALTLDESPVQLPDFNVFYRYAATFPWYSHGILLLSEMYRWGQIDFPVNLQATVAKIYRPDFYRQAAATQQLPYPTIDEKPEGSHPEPWTLNEATAPISMGPDQSLDGLQYHPDNVMGYMTSLGTGQVAISDLAVLNR
jgi:nitrate/nitrite transport system substrate-binding protein